MNWRSATSPEHAVPSKGLRGSLRDTAAGAFIRGVRWLRSPSPNVTFPLGRHGRLGNQLFQIAGTYALAQRLGVRVVLRKEWPYRPYFCVPDDWFAGRVEVLRCTVKAEWHYAAELGSDWSVYLQDLTLWDGRESEIQRLLQPSPRALQAVEAAYADLLDLPSKTAVHVRRGDYLSEDGLLRPCPPSYYELAVTAIRSRDPGTRFLVFSDDIDWCRGNLDIPDAVYVSGNPDWLDLAFMTRCEHHICANSTFSWWGAFLSDDPQPVVPWLDGTLPDAFRRALPGHWLVIEV